MSSFSRLQAAERLHKYYVDNKRGRKEFNHISSDDRKVVPKSEKLLSGKQKSLYCMGTWGLQRSCMNLT